jgi:hypothetical protein
MHGLAPVHYKIIGYARDLDLPIIYVPPGINSMAVDQEGIIVNEPFKILVASTPLSAPHRTGRVRPLVAGVSIGNALITAGTLGWFGIVGDDVVLISNAHVFTNRPESPHPPDNPNILQPGVIDGGVAVIDTVAHYHSHIPIKLVDESTCPVSRAIVTGLNALSKLLGRKTRFTAVVEPSNRVDVALATLKKDVQYNPLVMGDDGKPFGTSGELVGLLFAGSGEVYVVSKSTNILKYYPHLKFISAEAVDARVGDKVIKCGRTTGCTEGEVISTDAVIRVNYGVGVAVFEDVVLVRGKSAGGDSGSSVWLASRL